MASDFADTIYRAGWLLGSSMSASGLVRWRISRIRRQGKRQCIRLMLWSCLFF